MKFPSVATLVTIFVVALLCGGATYVIDRTPFIGKPFNAILKVIIIIGGIVYVLKKLGLFSGLL